MLQYHLSLKNISSERTLSPCIMSVQYTRGCAVQQGMFSTPGGYHEYSGDIMSTLGDIMSTLGGYHDKCRGRSFVWNPNFQIFSKVPNLYGTPVF